MILLLASLACRQSGEVEVGACQARLTGEITDGAGFGIPGATVAILGSGEQSTTDGDGVFTLERLSPDSDYRLRIEAEGYAPTYAEGSAGCWETGTTGTAMSEIDGTGTFNAESGGVVATDEVSVDFAANSIVDARGASYSGQVTVTVAYIDASTGEIWEGPGDLTGSGINTSTGEREDQLMVSYGMADISLYDPDGEPLQLAQGSTAAVSMDIRQKHLPEDVQLEDGSTQSLWWYDGETGAWIEEGLATVTDEGQRVNFEVSHFTWWNVDDGRVSYCATGCVVDMLDFPIRNAQVTCTAFAPPDFGENDGDGGDGGDRILNPDADSINVVYTDEAGCYECEVWAGSTAEFDAEITVKGVTYSANSGVLDILGTTSSMEVCEPIPTLEIEVCRESGIVMVDDLKVTGSTLDGVDADRARAWFWEPAGDPKHCADPWEAIPMDTCVVSSPQDFPQEFASTFRDRDWGLERSTRSAGSYLELSNGAETWRLEQESISGDPVYMWETVSVDGMEVNETPITVAGGDTLSATVPGSADSYFGPVDNQPWVGVPAPLRLSNVPSDGVFTLSGGPLELRSAAGGADQLFVFVTTAPDAPGLMCRYADDGNVSISSSDLNQLNADYGSVGIYRPEIGWVAGPDGLPIRVQGLGGEIVGADFR